MTRWQQTLEVARWEFRRFVKWKQQLVGFGLILALGLGGGFVGRMVRQVEDRPVPIAAVGAERLGYPLPEVAPLQWARDTAWTEASARAALEDGRLKGLLIVDGPTALRLVVPKRAGWIEPLEREANAARQATLLAALLANAPDGAAALAPLTLETEFLAPGAARSDRGTRIFAAAIAFLGLTLILGGFGTLFVGITGEKQHRVTEQLIAIVSPQSWMDGKILGLGLAALVGTGITAVGGVLVLQLLPRVIGRDPFALPPIASDLGTLALIVLITVLGVAMWFAFMAAVAATIDDPNSSTRSMLLFLPMLPMGAAFGGIAANADSTIVRAMSLFPLTSSATLPLRLAVTAVPWWETLLAIALLVGTVWLFRRAAGKIFGTAILMHGKEPSFREMWRWMRAS